jgi:poly(3-hydroxybutyrate) depolymerase
MDRRFSTHHDPANPMRFFSAIFLAFVAATYAANAAALAVPHEVEIPSKGAILHAQLFKPDGNGPFPVVIALHGCGGLVGRSEPVQPRYRDWAEQLMKEGR